MYFLQKKIAVLLVATLPIQHSYASVVDLERGVFEFNGIATLAILAGIFCIYLGFRIITKGIRFGPDDSVDVRVESNEHGNLEIKGAPPGVAFMILGVICVLAGVVGSIL